MKKVLEMDFIPWAQVDKLMEIEKRARWDFLNSLERPKTPKRIQAYVAQILDAYPNFSNARQVYMY